MYTVLIADDEIDERKLIRFLLQDFDIDFHILEASNGKEAYNLSQSNHIDILISDVQMPFYSGIELAEKIKETNPDIDVLFFSGYDDFSYIKAALSLKAVNYILKPVDPDEFHKYITEIVNGMNSHVIEYAKSEQYIENQFHDNIINSDNTNSSHIATDEEMQQLIKEAETAINLKQPDRLSSVMQNILSRYSDMPNLSHIYIRHICTTLLTMLLNALPSVSDMERQNAAKEIYSFLHFSDIVNLINYYTSMVVNRFRQEQNSSNYIIYQVEQYIQTHYQEDLTLTDLADIAYLNPNYLSNMFSSVTGCTLNKYIKNIRMQKAQELLLNTNMKITDISESVGFHNTSYFCKSFQKMFGTTPERFRQGDAK